jgi:predicted RNA-binding Zn ribbon-like protein
MQEIHLKSRFLWVGNWPAIDFINTDIIVEGKPVDLLKEPDDVVLWLDESRLCEKTDHGRLSPPKRLIDEARAYRGLLRQGIAQFAGQRRLPAGLLSKTNEYLRRCVAPRQLQEASQGYRSLTSWRLQSAEDYLVPIAESFASLVTEADPGRIRKCKNPECVLYFHDTSKGGHRAWCSLDLCGNKLRMAASRRRRSEEHRTSR